MGEKKSGITRRSFISGTATATLGAAVASVLPVAGCSSTTTSETTEETTLTFVKELNPQDESYDTYTTDYAAIFSPIQVGHMTLRNRIVKASAGSDTQTRGATEITQNAIDYYGRMADGGTALVLLEEGTLRPFGFSLGSALTDEAYEAGIENAKKMADRVHEGGAYIGAQIGLGSPIEPVHVNEYTLDEIHGFVEDAGNIGLRLKMAGFDCIEIKGATTDGLNAFLTRRQNLREDEYGPQSIENRIRFFVEMVQAVREACGDDFSVVVLINAVEENDAELGQNDTYITIEEAKEFAKLLEQAGAAAVQVRVATSGKETPGKEITCWAPDCNHAGFRIDGVTGFGTQFDYSSHFEGMLDGVHSGAGSFIPAAAEVKKVLSVPVGCAAYMDPRTSPDLINNAVADGKIDLVFMNRPLTVDPELPNKLQEGRRDEVAPCTRCLHCHARPLGGVESCRVNATTQHAYTEVMPEGYEPLPAETVKNVMVIGGGPAGMEAARVASQRGHSVTLYEKNGSLGGLMRTAAAFKGSHERLNDLVDYLTKQQELENVTVVTGTDVDAAFVEEQNPDVVIVAVGGLRDSKLGDSAAASPSVVGMEDVSSSSIGDKVVILGVGAQAVDLAFYLLAQGKSIQMIHGAAATEVDKEQSLWFQQIIVPQLYALGVKIWNEAVVEGVDDGGITITTDVGLEKTIECDTVIECYDMVPNTALSDALASTYTVYAVGDCSSPWNIQQAIYNANITARSI